MFGTNWKLQRVFARRQKRRREKNKNAKQVSKTVDGDEYIGTDEFVLASVVRSQVKITVVCLFAKIQC